MSPLSDSWPLGMQFDEVFICSLQTGWSVVPRSCPCSSRRFPFDIACILELSPHLKQNTFNTSDSHALNVCPTVPQFQQVHSLLRRVLDKALLLSNDPYIPGESRDGSAVWSIASPIFFPRRGLRVGVGPVRSQKKASLVEI
ncbi:uncharacterized protein LOC122320324 isoform X2 [Drosophila ficusphila]|uniref:uncharacterized protein LOC122320324 isoform X2 n=1 Tax=Drosophila ficusphila TaxID=30025 RepID=UPI001C89C244|nr:uncharacterized protein LOC122320324 isoform X2 [Drosophila ficusphila]